jgi:hypothetical protein
VKSATVLCILLLIIETTQKYGIISFWHPTVIVCIWCDKLLHIVSTQVPEGRTGVSGG